MIQLLKVNGDGTGVVNLRGLVRVVIQPEGDVADELCTPRQADVVVESFNACNSRRQNWAEAVPYTASRSLS